MLWKHWPTARVPTAFLVLPNFHPCLYNSIQTYNSARCLTIITLNLNMNFEFVIFPHLGFVSNGFHAVYDASLSVFGAECFITEISGDFKTVHNQ